MRSGHDVGEAASKERAPDEGDKPRAKSPQNQASQSTSQTTLLVYAARDLVSGRTFEQICHAAKRSAFLREVRSGEEGVRVADIEAATADAMQRMTSTLSVRNAHAYLADLPQDVDVVSVEPIKRNVSQPHRYLSIA